MAKQHQHIAACARLIGYEEQQASSAKRFATNKTVQDMAFGTLLYSRDQFFRYFSCLGASFQFLIFTMVHAKTTQERIPLSAQLDIYRNTMLSL